MIDPCWGMHASVVPSRSDEVIDKQGRHWHRGGVRVWQLDGAGDLFHESWLLREHGPVMCTTIELMLAERDERLNEQLSQDDDSPDHVVMPETGDVVRLEGGMALMRAGWLAWTSKQRFVALTSLCEAEARELAVTS